MTRVVVIGGGVAGCAAAVAAAEAGARVTLVEAAHHLGGVAAQGEHRTLCGLAPIDAPTPELLEPALTSAWVEALATGAAWRQGRVWLWPTDGRALQAGLARRLSHADVEVRRGARVVGSVDADDGPAPTLHMADGSSIPFDAVVNASGGAEVMAILCADSVCVDGRTGARAFPWAVEANRAVNWPAFRAELQGSIPTGTVARLRLESTAAAAASVASAALVACGTDRWQLSLDLPPGTSMAMADAAMHRAASALTMKVVSCARALALRDGGQSDAFLSLDDLFATTTRGWCWAAWPREYHGPDGVAWTWPGQDRYGIPMRALRTPWSPSLSWTVGKGMPVSSAAAAALRVTGTGLALGAALGTVIGREDRGVVLKQMALAEAGVPSGKPR